MLARVSNRFFPPSAIGSPSEAEAFAEQIGATVISFDFFDTLAYRQVADPNDVFVIQGQEFRERGLLPEELTAGWTDLRKTVEYQLCKSSISDETHFDIIYEEIGRRLNLAPDIVSLLKDAELRIEDTSLEPYNEVIATIDRLIQSGQTVVITTDTYLPVDFIRRVLGRWLSHDVAILCSSDTNKPKRTGAAFQLLTERFPGTSIAHFGDNPITDVLRARRSHVVGKRTFWQRQAWLKAEHDWLEYRRAAGALRLTTPLDSHAAHDNLPVETLAWRWASVLADFVRGMFAYAREIQATDIWFLSRDCEMIFGVLQEIGGFPTDIACTYVYSSRVAWYPIFAKTTPALFEKFAGRPTKDTDIAAGSRAIGYVNGLTRPDTRRLLMVDVGWLGRLQMALKSALPADIEVYGYYFSLGPGCEPSMRASARTFIDWDQSICSQALIESLMGYSGQSCNGYDEAGGGPLRPTFRDARQDRAPHSYCVALRRHLTALLQGAWQNPAPATLGRLRARAVRAICHLPDSMTLAALENWHVGISADPADTLQLLPTHGALLDRLTGRTGKRNLWAPGGVYYLIRSHGLRYAVIRLFLLREMAKAKIKRLLGSRLASNSAAGG